MLCFGVNALTHVVWLGLIFSTGMFIHAGAPGQALREPQCPVGFIQCDPTSLLKNIQCFLFPSVTARVLQETNASKKKKKNLSICIIKMHLKNTGIKYQTIIHFRAMNI